MTPRRVVITGFGIVSCIGNDAEVVTRALREGRSGIRYVPEYAELGLYSRVAGIPDLSGEPAIERKARRFMADAAIYAHHAMRKAVDAAKLTAPEISHPRTGLIVGSGVGSPFQHSQAVDILRKKGLSKVAPYYVPQVMGSTASASLAMAWRILGPSYSITSACATSAHCIGSAADQIRFGLLDRVFAGGAEEVHWTTTMPFDAMGALSRNFNDSPATASRPFDQDRDGFVIAGGAGVLVLEAEEIARARGATIFGELAGYAALTDGKDMVQPDARGAARTMQAALHSAGQPRVDYINAHATSTPLGDRAELDGIWQVLGENLPAISSTKGLSGHAIAASGAQEAIYCLLMLNHGFVAGSANLFTPDAATADMPLIRRSETRAIDTVLSNSIGFGGTNVSLVLRRY